MSIAEKLVTIAENEQRVYEAGQKSMIDESKIIEATATGVGSLTLNDVSEIPHRIYVTLKYNMERYFYIEFVDYSDGWFELYGKYNYGQYYPVQVSSITGDEIHIGIYNPDSNETSYYTWNEKWTDIQFPENTTGAKVCTDFLLFEDTGTGIGCNIYRVWNIENDKDYLSLPEIVTLTVANDNSSNSITYSLSNMGDTYGGDSIDISSSSPNMEFTVDNENIVIVVDYHKSWGMQYEYDRFWDKFQNYGNRTDYVYAFAGCGWMNHPIFPPKYLIKSPSRCFGMFAYFNFGGQAQYDMTEICKYVDFSGTNYCAQLFRNAVAKNITLDLSNCINTTEMFECYSGGSVDNITLKITKNLSNTTKMFYECDDLKELRFTEDSVLATSLDLSCCAELYKESITSVMNSLSKTSTGKKVIFNKTAVDNAFTTKEWETLVSEHSNWTIGLF